MCGTGNCWGMGFGMWLIPVLLVVVVIYFLKDINKDKTFSAQDILDKRYANGEINLEEYEEKSNTLKKNG